MMLRWTALAVLLLSAAAPGSAQVRYAASADAYTLYSGTGAPILRLEPYKLPPERLAQMFKDLCLTPKLDPDLVDAAISGSGWQADRYHLQLGSGDASSAQRIWQWAGDGMVLTVIKDVPAPDKEASLRGSRPQCSLFVGGGEQAGPNLIAALASAIGREPSNSADQTKNGRPNKRYKPKWQFAMTGDAISEISVLAIRPNYYEPTGVLMLTVLAAKPVK